MCRMDGMGGGGGPVGWRGCLGGVDLVGVEAAALGDRVAEAALVAGGVQVGHRRRGGWGLRDLRRTTRPRDGTDTVKASMEMLPQRVAPRDKNQVEPKMTE